MTMAAPYRAHRRDSRHFWPERGTEHDRLRNEAEASGVFGVPTFVFEGELFWGGDRIGLLRERQDETGVKRRPA